MIVVPGDTVIVAGENAIPAMVTVLGVAGELLLLLLLLEHETNIMEDSKSTLTTVAILFFIFGILAGVKNDCVFTYKERRETREGCVMKVKLARKRINGLIVKAKCQKSKMLRANGFICRREHPLIHVVILDPTAEPKFFNGLVRVDRSMLGHLACPLHRNPAFSNIEID